MKDDVVYVDIECDALIHLRHSGSIKTKDLLMWCEFSEGTTDYVTLEKSGVVAYTTDSSGADCGSCTGAFWDDFYERQEKIRKEKWAERKERFQMKVT